MEQYKQLGQGSAALMKPPRGRVTSDVFTIVIPPITVVHTATADTWTATVDLYLGVFNSNNLFTLPLRANTIYSGQACINSHAFLSLITCHPFIPVIHNYLLAITCHTFSFSGGPDAAIQAYGDEGPGGDGVQGVPSEPPVQGAAGPRLRVGCRGGDGEHVVGGGELVGVGAAGVLPGLEPALATYWYSLTHAFTTH